MLRLEGKTALVTGAGRGIGEAIAVHLALEGAQVRVTDVDGVAAETCADHINQSGGMAVAAKLDVTRQADWDAVAGQLTHLDILVHNAGIEGVAPFGELDLELWRRVQAVNVEAAFIGTKTLLKALQAAGSANPAAGASVILMSSVMGIVAVPDQCAYNTSKGALRQMAKALAIEFARKGLKIRVNSVHPGLINTPMAQEIIETWIKKGLTESGSLDDIKAAMAGMHPLGRLGRPEDIAFGVVYLASDEASFVTGSELVIDGGWTAQ